MNNLYKDTLSNKNYKNKIREAINLIKLNNNCDKGWIQLGIGLYNLELLNKSRKCFKKVLQLNKNNNIAKQYIKDIDDKYINLEDIDCENIIHENDNTIHEYDNIISNTINNLLYNEKLQQQLDNINFNNKILKYKNNPVKILQDNDIINILNLMIKKNI